MKKRERVEFRRGDICGSSAIIPSVLELKKSDVCRGLERYRQPVREALTVVPTQAYTAERAARAYMVTCAIRVRRRPKRASECIDDHDL